MVGFVVQVMNMPNMSKNIIFIVVCVFLSGVATGERSLIKPRLDIGLVLPMSGSLAPYGNEVKRGADIALGVIKQRDPELAMRLKLVFRDNQGLSAQSLAEADKLFHQDKVHVLLGGISRVNARELASIAQKAQRPFVSLSLIADTNDVTFPTCMVGQNQGSQLAKFAFSEMNKKTALLATEEKSDYSAAVAKSFATDFQRLGGKVVGEVAYFPGQTTFEQVVSKLKATKPEVVVLPAHYLDADKIIGAAVAAGFKGLFLGSDSWDSGANNQATERGGHFYYTPFSVSDPAPAVVKFVSDFEVAYGRKPSSFAAIGYESLMSIVAVFEAADSNRGNMLVRIFKGTYCKGSGLKSAKNANSLGEGGIMATSRSGATFFKPAM